MRSLDPTSHYEVPAPSPGSLCSCHSGPWRSHLVERGGHDVERRGLGPRPLLQPHPHERWRSIWVWCLGTTPPPQPGLLESLLGLVFPTTTTTTEAPTTTRCGGVLGLGLAC